MNSLSDYVFLSFWIFMCFVIIIESTQRVKDAKQKYESYKSLAKQREDKINKILK